MGTRDEHRSEIQKAYGDAVYDTWMRGGDPDRVDRGDVTEAYYETYDRYDAAAEAVRRAME